MDIYKFKEDLESLDISLLVSKYIVEKKPLIFKSDKDYYFWRENFAKLIDVDSKDICFVGSSATGFSLNPNKSFKSFSDDSDLDIAVISHYYFEQAWYYLRNIGTDIYSLSPKEKNSVKDHVQRLIYWGTISTDNILHLLPFGKSWIKAVSKIKSISGFDYEINIRIYRDYRSLRTYHINNLNNLRTSLLSISSEEEIIE